MRKSFLALALLLLAGGSAFGQEKTTRFGVLSINDDKVLLFKGQPIKPTIEGNNGLDLGEPYQIGDTDVVLITDEGGTACPSLYYFVTLSKSGAKVSQLFGTCSDLITIKRTGDSISVTMKGFAGPFEPARDRRKAALERHLYIFRGGVVTENGKPVKGDD
jgi:hypothetical protein